MYKVFQDLTGRTVRTYFTSESKKKILYEVWLYSIIKL